MWLSTGQMIHEIKNGQIAEGQDEQKVQRRDLHIWWVDDEGNIETHKGHNGLFIPCLWDYEWKLKPLISIVD